MRQSWRNAVPLNLMVSVDDSSFADDLETGEPSPYRRRQKVVPVRRTRFAPLKRVLRALLCALVVIPPLAFAGYRATLFALNSPQFTLASPSDVIVEGNRYVSNEELLNALGLTGAWRRGTPVNTFQFSLRRARRELESIPWVREASLTRAYPHRLIVRITERVPVAFVSAAGKLELVDGEGVLLEMPEKATFDFPVVSGLDSGVSPRDRKLRLDILQEFLRQTAAEARMSGWMVSEVDLSDDDDLKATVFHGQQTIELHLGHSDFERRFHNFLSLLSQIGSNGTQIDSMDLRYGGQVVVNPRRAAAGGGESARPGALPTRKR